MPKPFLLKVIRDFNGLHHNEKIQMTRLDRNGEPVLRRSPGLIGEFWRKPEWEQGDAQTRTVGIPVRLPHSQRGATKPTARCAMKLLLVLTLSLLGLALGAEESSLCTAPVQTVCAPPTSPPFPADGRLAPQRKALELSLARTLAERDRRRRLGQPDQPPPLPGPRGAFAQRGTSLRGTGRAALAPTRGDE